MASQAGNFNVQEFADGGVPLVGGRLYTYAFGTTTQKDAYTDADGAIPQTYTSDGAGGQYIALNSRGELPAPLYLASGSYDLTLKRADGTTVWTRRADGQASSGELSASGGAAMVGFLQAGTGAVARTLQAKGRDVVSVADFADASGAVSGSVGGVITVPADVVPTLPTTYGVLFDYLKPTEINVFQETAESTRHAKRLLRAMDAGSHTGEEISVLAMENHPAGSGTNGPTNADYTLTVSALKKDFATTSVVGEIDGVSIALRQGGAGSDGCAILTNVATYGTGFMAAMESTTLAITGPSTTDHQVRTQLCVCDNVNDAYFGLAAIKEVGNAGTAFYSRQGATARWDNFLQFFEDSNLLLQVDKSGQITMQAQSGLTPKKTIRSSGGSFSILNDAGTGEILNLTDAGLLTVPGSVVAASLKVSANQVVGARITGWSASSNGSRAALNGSTATLAQTSAALAQLLADLVTHGLIGA